MAPPVAVMIGAIKPLQVFGSRFTLKCAKPPVMMLAARYFGCRDMAKGIKLHRRTITLLSTKALVLLLHRASPAAASHYVTDSCVIDEAASH